MERVPTLKSELKQMVEKYPGHLIATTACLGGELSTHALAMQLAEDTNDRQTAEQHYYKILDFLNYCKSLFGEDFYIECAPSADKDQIIVNNKLMKIASAMNIKMVVGTDSHYLTKEDRFVHKAYLNSKDGDREIDSFYEFSRLMDYDEVKTLLTMAFGECYKAEKILENTNEIREKIKFYSLEKKQIIPKVKVPFIDLEDLNPYIDKVAWAFLGKKWPTLYTLYEDGNEQERYWLYECSKNLYDKKLHSKINYWDRLEIEANVIKFIGDKLDDCLFAYFNTFKHYIDLFWECGSIVGPVRGSATGFLSNYL